MATSGHFHRETGDWPCHQCNEVNFKSRNACRRCGTQRTNTPANSQQPKAGDWICSFCNTNNFASRSSCYKCQRGKPQSNPAAEIIKSGDWVCGQCSVNNFASRTACYKCNRARDNTQVKQINTNANSSAATQPGDWKCPSCPETNFGSRTVCRRCGGARPNENTNKAECVICMDKPIDSVITTCGHSAVCLECGSSINTCPICRNTFTHDQLIKLFLVH